jgi:NADH-quinone oxidoreductase subunit M
MHGPPRGVLLEPAAETPAPVTGAGGGATTATATLEAPAAAPAGLRVRDLSRREVAVAAPMVALIIALGVYPQPLIDLVEPAVAATMSDVGSDPAGVSPEAPGGGTD